MANQKAKPPARSPLPLSDEEAEDASGPPQPLEGEDASGPPLNIPVDVPAAPVQPAIDDLAPPATSELAQVLAALAAQAQQMAALQAELKDQKRAAKAAEKAHIRAMVARAEAEKGRVMPIGAFVPAGLVPDPPSPGLTPSGISRASQADPSRGPAPTIIEKKRARAAFTGGGGAVASPLYATEPDCPCNSHPTLVSKTDPEDPRNIFRCPFVSCLWSCKKCSAASGIHHMQSCICRPEDYHLQIVDRITSCFVKHPRLNDATKCYWCGLIMGGLSRDQRSKHRNDCIKVGVRLLLPQLYNTPTYCS